MSSSHRGTRAPIGRIQLILRLSLVLAIALLSIPVLGAIAKADDGTPPTDPAATAAEEPAQEPPEEPAAEPSAEPATEEAAEQPQADAAPAADPDPAADPAPEAGPTKQDRTLATSNLTRTVADSLATATSGSSCAASFDQSTQQVHNTGHNYDAVSESKWINGNLNNDGYAEGDYVPQRVKLTGLQAGVTQTLTFRYDRQVSGKYAFDFVADLQMSGGAATWDAAPGNPPMPPAGAVFVTISFTPTGSSAVLYWEGHIASELDYLDLGLNLGAGSISGSNYHFFLESLSCGNVGGQTNQMKSADVAAGQVTVIKDAQPNSPQDFGFLIQAPNASNDTVLDDDGDPTRSNETHSRVAPGNTTITETQVPGWTLASITCTQTAIGQTGGTAITPVSVDLAAGKVTVAIADDKNVTCTFVNTRQASVSVAKQWVVKSSTADPGTTYTEATKPAHLGLNAQLTLTGPGAAGASNQAWGVTRGGYLVGDTTTINESRGYTNPLCDPVSSTIAAGAGSPVDLGSGHTATLAGGDNAFTVTNTVLCTAKVTLVKVVDNGPAVATAWTLSATRTDPGDLEGPSGVTGTPAATGRVTAGAAYTLAETGGDTRYVANGAWTCSNDVAVDNSRIQVAAGRSTTCTLHNATAKITLVKTVTNDDGGNATAGQWTLHAGAFSGSTGQSFWVKPGQAYALSESGGPSGYDSGPSSLTCSDAPGTQVTSVTPAAGASITCTFVNDDEPATLALTKVMSQGDSGAQTPAGAFTLTATPQGITGQVAESGAGGYPPRPVKAGTYLLSETGPSGYTPGTWNCTGGTMGGTAGAQTVTVANGGSASCTITNTAIMPALTLVKERETGTTGSQTPATAWTLTANGPTMIAGSTGSTGPSGVTGRSVPIGTYALSETGPADGWTASDWVCTGGATMGGTPAAPTVTIGLGQNVICTITNTAQPAHLTLDKDARANGTGTGVGDTAWTLTYAGPATAGGPGGVARTVVPIGGYTLTETGPTAGWTASAWTCTRALPGGGTTGHQVTTDPDGTGHVNLALGQDVSCQVVNTARPSYLALDKDARANGSGTTLGDLDWTLAFDGPDAGSTADASGAGGVPATMVGIGDYTLTEAGPTAGWTAGAWSCGGHPVTTDADGVGHLTIGLGQNVSCTIVNTATAPTLTLVKDVERGSTGTTTPATAWTLTAAGPTMVSGITGSTGPTGVTGRTVRVGTYTLSESGPTDGWSASDWVCSAGTIGGTKDARTVTIGLGQHATCTVTNTAKAAHLTLDKDARANGTGSTLGDTAWALAYDGPDAGTAADASGAGGVARTEVPIGAYTLTETGPTAGWTASAWSCGGHPVTTDADGAGHLHVALGEDVSCTIVNTAQPAHLTLDKDARANGTGSDLGDDDWTLAFDGPDAGSGADASGAGGVARTQVGIGAYTLTETGPTAGWTAGTWECGGHPVTTDADGAGHLDISLGEEVSCTIVNTAMKPGLTLLKKVDGHGTGAETYTPDTSWTLHADLVGDESPAVGISGTEGTPAVTGAAVPVGTYALSESGGPAPWTTVGWACTDAEGAAVPVANDRVTIALGQDVACEVTNRAVPSTWAVTKANTPGTGMTVHEGDVVTYTVTATKNPGGVDVLGAEVTDDLSDILPEKGTVVGSVVTSSGTTDQVGTSIVWTIPRLGDAPQTMTYQVLVGGLDGVTLRNHATGDGAEECLKGDPDCTTTNPTPHYLLDKAVDFDDPDGDGRADPGQDLTYTLTVRNDTAHAVVDDVVVLDDLSDVLLDAAMASTSEELAAQGLALEGPEGDEYLEWTVPGPVGPGDSVTAAYVVTIDAHAWGRSLRNVATPQGNEGECVGTHDGDECTTTTETPQVTTLVVKKVDMEDDAEVLTGLPGAEFELYRDQGTIGVQDDADVLVPPLDDPDGDGDMVTGPDGLARWGEIRPGRYLVVEVVAPAGYALPDPNVMAVVVSEPGNFVPGQEMATIVFRDIAEGQLTITKAQSEQIDGEWVPSDGVVAHGDLVKYTLHVETQGLKRFHDVTVRDYVPNRDPEDATSTGTASLVPGSAICLAEVVCTVDVADGLITWHLGTVEEDSVDVEFVVRFPVLPGEVTYDENDEFRTVLWNQAYLDWRQVSGRDEGGLVFEPRSAVSNQVEVRAVVTQPEEPAEPPIVPEGPAVPPVDPPSAPALPGTGSPEHLLQLAILGGLSVALGVWLVGGRRRREGAA